jgi:hypothetical protein
MREGERHGQGGARVRVVRRSGASGRTARYSRTGSWSVGAGERGCHISYKSSRCGGQRASTSKTCESVACLCGHGKKRKEWTTKYCGRETPSVAARGVASSSSASAGTSAANRCAELSEACSAR